MEALTRSLASLARLFRLIDDKPVNLRSVGSDRPAFLPIFVPYLLVLYHGDAVPMLTLNGDCNGYY